MGDFNMYRVLIAEDEAFIRRSIITQIDWVSLDCEVVGETDNGQDAIRLLESLKPDILLSDIRLEGLSGMEAVRFIHDRKLSVQPILITGYGDLSYAKEAIQLNVVDFILKPIDPEELKAAIRKAVGLVREERERVREMELLYKQVQESKPLLLERFLLQLANGMVTDSREIEQNAAFFDFPPAPYIVAALELDDYAEFQKTHSPMERKAYELAIRECCREAVARFEKAYDVSLSPNCQLLFIPHDSVSDVVDLAEQIQEKLFREYGLSVSFGIARPERKFGRLSERVEEARQALRHKFYSGNRAVIPYADAVGVEEGATLPAYPSIQAVTQAVLAGNTAEAAERLEEAWNAVSGFPSEEDIKNLAMEWVIVVRNAVRSRQIAVRQQDADYNVYALISKQQTIQDIRQTVFSLILDVARQVENSISSRYRSTVERILAYIDQNYDREITLQELAELVYMNPKYVSRLLKQETGENFSSLLTQIRIRRAMELMDSEECKVYEVARKVGINDSRYFSQMFKKHTGMTPLEYRYRRRAPENKSL